MTKQGPVLPRLKLSHAVVAPAFATGRGKGEHDSNHKRRHTQAVNLPNTIRGDARLFQARRQCRPHPVTTARGLKPPGSMPQPDPMTAAGLLIPIFSVVLFSACCSRTAETLQRIDAFRRI